MQETGVQIGTGTPPTVRGGLLVATHLPGLGVGLTWAGSGLKCMILTFTRAPSIIRTTDSEGLLHMSGNMHTRTHTHTSMHARV